VDVSFRMNKAGERTKLSALCDVLLFLKKNRLIIKNGISNPGNASLRRRRTGTCILLITNSLIRIFKIIHIDSHSETSPASANRSHEI
jgi:hypothetical protein